MICTDKTKFTLQKILFLLLVHKNVWILWTFTAFMNVIYCLPSYSLPSCLLMQFRILFQEIMITELFWPY